MMIGVAESRVRRLAHLRGEFRNDSGPQPARVEFLRSIDTPTVYNLIEIVAPERRGSGYTVRHLHCPFPHLPPMVGFAKTVTIEAKDAIAAGDASYLQRRLEYLDYIAAEPRPSIVVIEDLEGENAGYGAFWGEVQSNVHKALGCLVSEDIGGSRDSTIHT